MAAARYDLKLDLEGLNRLAILAMTKEIARKHNCDHKVLCVVTDRKHHEADKDSASVHFASLPIGDAWLQKTGRKLSLVVASGDNLECAVNFAGASMEDVLISYTRSRTAMLSYQVHNHSACDHTEAQPCPYKGSLG